MLLTRAPSPHNPMAFLADIRHWPTVAEFAAHLAAHDPTIEAWWAQGLTLHHTYRPLASQWQGRATMDGLQNHYSGLGWRSGPHLFLVWGSPDPRNDGIWQLTPLNMPGTHAGNCNKDHWGIEVVGDFDRAPWPLDLAELVYGTGTALLGWRNLAQPSIKGHRECLPNKSCPGNTINMAVVRDEFAFRLRVDAPAPTPALNEHSPIMAPPRCTQAQALAHIAPQLGTNYTRADVALSILPAYWSLCTSVGLDPCVAAAQMLHETGYLSSFWSARPQRNPAGIKVNGRSSATKPNPATDWAYNPQRQRWEYGLSFASWASHAIPAHVGRLLAYATIPVDRTPAQAALVAQALKAHPLPLAKLHGSAPTLRELGQAHNRTGSGWAKPGTDYGQRIAVIAQAMVEEAL